LVAGLNRVGWFEADGDGAQERTSIHADEHEQPGPCHKHQGKNEQAEEMHREALKQREMVLDKSILTGCVRGFEGKRV